MTGFTCCQHGVNTEFRCIECHLEVIKKRLETLKGQHKSKAVTYEIDMLEFDFKRLCAKLANGEETL